MLIKSQQKDVEKIRRQMNPKARMSMDGAMNKLSWHCHLKITSYNLMKPLENTNLYFSFTVAHSPT